ncbi:hypothetical protein JCM4814A_91400 [Streptomyces phaeofaciens JCM 4814]|uniref:Uncharacterized protein n=1 Tax=Streptomyces phaeofaciens TaxID=68254 RepID=A0A918HBM7_9ACTN|nr:hypothetical protein GCM10010226_30130 [Streptomyces phaeofaciens]
MLPHRFTGRCTGSWIPLPDTTPGESAVVPVAVESANAGMVTAAIAPEAAATASTPFRVTRLMGPCLPDMVAGTHPHPLKRGRTNQVMAKRPFTPSSATAVELITKPPNISSKTEDGRAIGASPRLRRRAVRVPPIVGPWAPFPVR